jgi:hypothetical protein
MVCLGMRKQAGGGGVYRGKVKASSLPRYRARPIINVRTTYVILSSVCWISILTDVTTNSNIFGDVPCSKV